MLRLVRVVAASLLVAGTASARTEFTLIRDGKPLPGGEICFRRTAPSADFHPTRYWFYDNDVRCQPTDVLLDLPPGRFHFYGRHPKGLVSGYRMSFSSAEPSDQAAYKQIVIPVHPAAIVEFHEAKRGLARGEWIAILTADTEQDIGTVIPVPDGAGELMVPADVSLTPIVVAEGRPVRVGSQVTVPAGERRSIVIDPPGKETGDIVAWVELDPLAREVKGELAPMQVSLTSRAGREVPGEPRIRHGRVNGALQVFRDVPAGPAVVKLYGRTWEIDELDVTAESGRVVLAQRPLRAAPGAALSVRYVLPPTAVPLAAARNRSCDEAPPTDDGELTFTLYRCPNDDSQQDMNKCEAKHRMAKQRVTADFVSVSAGQYVLEASHSILGPTRRTVTLRPATEIHVDVEPTAFPIFGRVTYGGQPARVTLTFASDSPFERRTTTSQSGEYATILAFEPERSGIDIKACDGSFEYRSIPKEPLTANVSYDIAIPANRLEVLVTDARTASPVSGAVVLCKFFETSAGRERKYGGGRRGVADTDGLAVFTALSDDRSLECCAVSSGYRSACSPELRMADGDKRNVTLRLTREGVIRGSVVPGDIWDVAGIYFVNPAGEVTEAARIEAGGEFFLTKTHSIPEYIVIASTNQPLVLVEGWSTTSQGDIVVAPSLNAPAREFNIHAPAGDDSPDRVVGISIGGRHVPQQAFEFHVQNQAKTLPVVRRGAPLRVPKVVMSGPIAIGLGPELTKLRGNQYVDVFIRPEFARSIRWVFLPPTSSDVVF